MREQFCTEKSRQYYVNIKDVQEIIGCGHSPRTSFESVKESPMLNAED